MECIVFKTAILQNSDTTNQRRIKYYVKFDDDIELYDTNTAATSIERQEHGIKFIEDGSKPLKQIQAWKTLHQMLLADETTHPIIRPQDYVRAREKYDIYESCTDGHFFAVSPNHMSLLFPFSTYAKHVFWVSDHIMWALTERCYPASYKVDHRWTVVNEQHRYTPGANYERANRFKLTTEASN